MQHEQTVELFARELAGDAENRDRVVIVLHGLFGSSRNWSSTARALVSQGADARFLGLDLRNHGDSPHHHLHTVEAMSADVRRIIETRLSSPPVLLGHSMGGQAAMALALESPDLVRALVVVDIAPRTYKENHSREIAALSVDVSGMQSRDEVDEAMAAHVPDPEVRQFLQMNLERTDSGFRWRLNVSALAKGSPTGSGDAFEGQYRGPALFLAGDQSSYVVPEDRQLIESRFPSARIEILDGGNHWLHVSRPEQFRSLVAGFLKELPE